MMLAPLTGLALVVLASTGPTAPVDHAPMSVQQKNTAMQPFLRGATECIAQTVANSPHFREQAQSGKLGDLIVDSMPTCAGSVRAMIDAYDRFFGDGSGEAFFMGPYLDVLPTAVSKWVEQFRR